MEVDKDTQQVITQNIPHDLPKKPVNMWMVISVILLVILVGLGAYELGKSQTISPKGAMPHPSVMQVSASPTVAQQSPTATVAPVSTGKKVSAGIKNQFFSPYTITVPSGWVDVHTTNTANDTLTITKGQYTVTISQAAGGAGGCDFPGDTPEPMAQVFTSFAGITGTYAQFRRGTADNLTYTVCEQKSGGFAFPTSVGYITYKLPAPADKTILSEMDGMVASLTK